MVKEYNSTQKREDRKIKDYFEHVAGINQDMAGASGALNSVLQEILARALKKQKLYV